MLRTEGKNGIWIVANGVIWKCQFIVFSCLQGMLTVGRNCTQYMVEGKAQRIAMLDILPISCVCPYHQMENTW